MRLATTFAIVLVFSAAAFAEVVNVEFTGSLWLLRPSGHIDTTSTRVDLRSDLGMRDRRNHPAVKFMVKAAPKHRFNVELIFYRLKGTATVERQFQLGGRTYTVLDRIDSKGNVNYFFGGYQYDLVNNDRGHAGLTIGAGYFGASALVTSQRFPSTPGREERKIPLPLIGEEFRFFPIPSSTFLSINGEVKGMSFGQYGRYIQAGGGAGFGVSRFVRLQAGFNYVDADLHQKDRAQGFKLRFAGPIFSVQVHD